MSRRSERSAEAGDDRIEFLAPRADLFGGTSGGFTAAPSDDTAAIAFGDVDERPSMRGGTAVAAIGLAAFLGVGVIAAAPWSSNGTATPVVTTVPDVATTRGPNPSLPGSATSVAPSTTEWSPEVYGPSVLDADVSDLAVVPGYVTEAPPEGFTLAGASDQQAFSDPHAWLTIWAADGSDRTNGTWLAASATQEFDPSQPVGRDASPVAIAAADGSGESIGLLTTDADGVVSIVWHPDERTRFEIAAGGMPLDLMLAVAGGLQIVDEEDQLHAGVAPTDATGLPLTRVVDEARGTAELGRVSTDLGDRTSYYSGPDNRTGMVLGARTYDDAEVTISRFLLATAHAADGTPLARHIDPMSRDLVIGVVPSSPHIAAVQWREGDDWLTMLSTEPAEVVLRSSRSVRLADEAEWAELLAGTIDPGGDTTPPLYATIGSGTTPLASGWGALLFEDDRVLVLRSNEFYVADHFDELPADPVLVYRTIDTTFVVAVRLQGDDPASSGAQLQLTVRREGEDDLVAPLVDVDGGTWAGAVVAFDGHDPFEAAIDGVGIGL